MYEAWVNLTSEITVQQLAAVIPALISPEVVQSDHYFISNAAGNGISPVWDFRTNQKFQGQENAIFVGKGVGSVVPPVDPPNNINWLRVGKVAGDIADEVYRIDTIGGQPPTSVSPPLTSLFGERGSLTLFLPVHARPVPGYQRQIRLPVLVLRGVALVIRVASVWNPRS